MSLGEINTYNLFIETFKQSKFPYSFSEIGEAKILVYEIDDLKFHFKFIGQGLSGVFCEYSDDPLTHIPMFILTHCKKWTYNQINILEKNLILFEYLNSIRFYKSKKSISDFITTLRHLFGTFKNKVIEEYNIYTQNTKTWLSLNYAEKSESLYALWNVPENDYFIEIGEKEYTERCMKIPANGFVPFKVMVTTKNSFETEVRLIVNTEKGFRYHEYIVNPNIDFSSMLEVFANWVSNNEQFGDRNHFGETNRTHVIANHILKNYSIAE